MLLQAKEVESVPSCTGHLPGDRAQRSISLAVELKPVPHHPHGDQLASILSLDSSSDRRQSSVAYLWSQLYRLEIIPELTGRSQSQIDIGNQLCSPESGAFTEIAFRTSLEPPGDPPKQVRSI